MRKAKRENDKWAAGYTINGNINDDEEDKSRL